MGVPWVNYLVMRRSRDGIVQVFPMNYYNIFISPVLALSFDEMTVAQSSLAAAKAKCILPTNQPTAPYHKWCVFLPTSSFTILFPLHLGCKSYASPQLRFQQTKHCERKTMQKPYIIIRLVPNHFAKIWSISYSSKSLRPEQSKMEEKKKKREERKQPDAWILVGFCDGSHKMIVQCSEGHRSEPPKAKMAAIFCIAILHELLTQKLEHAWTMPRHRELQHVLAVDTL